MTDKHLLLEKIPAPASETHRQKIIAELMEHPMTAKDLSKAVHISEKEVISHLEHVKKSLKSPKHLVMTPSVCSKCRFVFEDRRRFSSPSRCPKCRHEGISPPLFQIVT